MYFSGQSYEIKLKKLGDLSNFKGKYLRVSTNPICDLREEEK